MNRPAPCDGAPDSVVRHIRTLIARTTVASSWLAARVRSECQAPTPLGPSASGRLAPAALPSVATPHARDPVEVHT